MALTGSYEQKEPIKFPLIYYIVFVYKMYTFNFLNIDFVINMGLNISGILNFTDYVTETCNKVVIEI